MVHDFKKFPELTNNQMQFYYWESPHKQLVEDFNAVVIKVIDGDTVRVKITERDFDFPIRLAKIQAPELDEEGGLDSAVWLRDKILGNEVRVVMNFRNRVEKFGRLIGDIIFGGDSMSEASIRNGHSLDFWDAIGRKQWR